MADKKRCLLAQMTREPLVGKVKSRLWSELGATGAMRLHARMTEHVNQELCRSGLGVVQLWVDGNPDAAVFSPARERGAQLMQQCAGDLGARMAQVCRAGLKSHDLVLLVGSDTPAIDADYLRLARSELEHNEVVLGPATDGGYVLMGMRHCHQELFEDIEWGTDQVLVQTCSILERLEVGYTLLAELPDIDRPEDLRRLPESWGYASSP